MRVSKQADIVRSICRKTKSRSMKMPAALVRSAIVEQISKEQPQWPSEGFICTTDPNRFRMHDIESLLESEKGELGALDRDVLESLKLHETLTSNIDVEFEKGT